jgi:DNA polymerase
MTPLLDARQRAMLAEMGVRVWQPAAGVSAPPTAEQGAPVLTTYPAPPLAAPPIAKPSLAALKTVVLKPPLTPLAPAADEKTTTPLPAGLSSMNWTELKTAAASCQACPACHSRSRIVFADGTPAADQAATDWLVIGDAPNDLEDASGTPFSGPEGVLLDAMLHAMGLKRGTSGGAPESVVLVNALKCKPDAQRQPSAFDIAQCRHFLQRQIELLQPRMILVLGRLAAQSVLQGSVNDVEHMPLGKLRGQLHQAYGRPVVVTYHPAYLLRTPSDKAKAWSDLCLAMGHLRGSSN